MRLLLTSMLIMLFFTSPVYPGDSLLAVGSSTVRPIIKQASKIFKKETGISVKVKGGGSGKGVKSAADGSADIGMVSRKLKSEEANELHSHLIGMDGIALIVHSSNPVMAVTKQQVVDIYTGKIKNWKELGGPDAAISAETKEEGRSTKGLFEKYFGVTGKVIPSAHVIGSNTEAIAYVSGTPFAIGYVSVGTAEGAAKKGIAIKLLDLDGVKTTSENVANKSYPLRRELNLVTKVDPTGETQQFIEFMMSSVGQKIVSEREFVSVR